MPQAQVRACPKEDVHRWVSVAKRWIHCRLASQALPRELRDYGLLVQLAEQ